MTMHLRISHLALALLMAVSTFAIPAAAPVQAAGLTVQRVAGADRYATAATVSSAHFPAGVTTAYVATGAGFADALAGGPAAALEGAPMLLVKGSAVPPATAAELARLRPGRIVVLGGTAVVSDAVLAALDAYDTGGGVSRLAGEDRYETAAQVSATFFPEDVAVAYVATGLNFPDALVGGIAAARAGAPMLLTRPDRLPPSIELELRRLAPKRIVVLGGSTVVSDTVVRKLDTLTTGGVSRLSGPDRYATAAAVSRSTLPDPAPAVFIATGANFPDALVSVPAAARSGAALLLVPGASVPASIRAEAVTLAPSRLVLLGGMGVIDEHVTFDLRVALGDLAPLPACAYRDDLTAFRTHADWHRTLVDTRLMVPSDYHPTDVVDSSNAGVNAGYGLRSHVVADLRAMADAARAAGRPIQVVSGFRSYATQETTFNHWVSVMGYEEALRVSARPGHSEHQLGTTLDLTSLGGRAPWDYADWAATPAGAWTAANAWRYGFVMSYPRDSFSKVCYDYEPWHYRYLGREKAKQVHESGLTLREWLWFHGSGG